MNFNYNYLSNVRIKKEKKKLFREINSIMTPQGLKNKPPTCIPDVFACKEDRRKTTI